MTDLTAPKPRSFRGAARSLVTLPVEANTAIWAGMALGVNANGVIAPCAPLASGKFAGFAHDNFDNRTGNANGNSGLIGAGPCKVDTDGLVELTVAHTGTYARTDVGSTVYASDSDTFTLSAGTNNIVIGKIEQVPEGVVGAASGVILVRYQSSMDRSI